MRNFLLGVLTALLVLVVGGLAYLKLGLVEVRGDRPPSRLEAYLMSSAVHASVRRHAPQVQNPIPLTDENLIAGGKQYRGECSGCHGTPGKPDRFPGSLVSRPAPVSHGWNQLHRSASLLGGEARHPPFRNVRQRFVGFRRRALAACRVYQENELAAAARAG